MLYRSVIDDSRIIINLASKEYSKCIEKYLTSQDRYITIVFCELSGDKLVTKGTYAKMARGEMVRFIAENNIENPVEIQKFDRLGYSFRSDLSSDSEYVFERKINLLERIHNTHGIEFVDYDISFKGICPKCREKVKEEQHG